jgi:hypothetical protein
VVLRSTVTLSPARFGACYRPAMIRLVPFLVASGIVLGIAGIVLAASGETVLGLALLAVGIADAAVALVVRSRGRF